MVVTCVLPWVLGVVCVRWWLVVVVLGWGGHFWVVVVVFMHKSKRERRGSPNFMWTVTTTCVVTVWTMWHVC